MKTSSLIGIALLLVSRIALSQIQPKNILVIMTDDQRWDTVSQMPKLSAIAAQGVTFTNAMQTTPLCGPSRSSLYSGGYYSQNTGVLGNSPPNGSVSVFKDSTNLGVMLQGVGYSTTFIGKWINGYENIGKYVPPGWTHWVGRRSSATTTSWFAFQYTLGSSNSTSNKLGTIVNSNAYTTYYERDQVLNTLNAAAANPSQPFFILWAPTAPHTPATPAPEDAALYPDYLYRDRGVTEADLTDKPKWVQQFSPAGLGAYGLAYGDPFIRNQLRSLQGVDRSIQAIIEQLKANGQYDNTLIIFTGDNGYEWGEHRLWAKAKPYQESLRVPFIVLMPGVAPRTDASIVAPDLDIGPTLFELAGISKTTEGHSLLPLLADSAASWRTSLYIEESDNSPGGNAIWAGSVDANREYVKYWTGEEELYDLNADPYQLINIQADPSQAAVKAALQANTLGQIGLAVIPVSSFKVTKHGTPFSFQMLTWGGIAPLHWTVSSGALPRGITISPVLGLISGIPTTVGTYSFALRVVDSSYSPQTLLPRTFVTRTMKIVIN